MSDSELNTQYSESRNGNFRLRGMGVAMVTPFREDLTIDVEALDRLVEHIVTGGADFIVVLGTTAETPTLSPEERDFVARRVVEKTAGRLPLVLGVGGNCTRSVCDELSGRDLSGYSAILSVVPFYNKPTQEGIFRHYCDIAEASPVPVILYNVPGRTGRNMTAETTLRLAQIPNIIGVKEASGDLDQIYEIVERKPEGFEVISGDDAITIPLMRRGVSGVISVAGNAYPREMAAMVHTAANDDFRTARSLDRDLSDIYRLLFADGNPGGIKALLASMGMMQEVLRLPLVPVGDEVRRELAAAAEAFADRS